GRRRLAVRPPPARRRPAPGRTRAGQRSGRVRDAMMRGGTHLVGAILAALVAVSAVTAPAAHAVTPQEVLADKALEARAREISAELRCLVCQNQSIDDSDAPLAHDLRVLVRERLVAGDTDQQVRDFVVARYGEFVLLNPPFSP